jgi:hypothetical protein
MAATHSHQVKKFNLIFKKRGGEGGPGVAAAAVAPRLGSHSPALICPHSFSQSHSPAPFIRSRSSAQIKKKRGGGVGTLCCCCHCCSPPWFALAHPSLPTLILPIPLTCSLYPLPFIRSRSPALVCPLSRSPAPISPLPCLPLHVRVIHIPTPTCTRPPACSFVVVYTRSSVLVPVCAYSPRLFCACSHLRLVFIRACLRPLGGLPI